MGALVTVMVSPKLADGCDVAKDAVAALVADGWTPPEEAAFEQHIRDICAPAIAWTVAWIKRRPLIHNGRKPTARRKKR